MKALLSLGLCLSLGMTIQARADDFKLPVENYLRPSPNAAALVKYVDYPVSYATGVPEISIPIYTVKTKELEMPISISYHAAGVKIGEQATNVGFGWALNCGGAVTRVVKGLPDTSGTDIRQRDNIQESDLSYVKSFKSGLQDAYYDTYYYNFNGYSGEFIRHPVTNEIVQMPQTDNIIVAEGSAGNDESLTNFTITTPDGVIYRFTEKEYVATDNYRTVSSWYLSKVISPNKTDSLTLVYSSEPEWRHASPYSYVTTHIYDPEDPFIKHAAQSSTTTYTQCKCLSSIEFNTGSVVLDYKQDRQDGGPLSRLVAVRCNSKTGRILEAVLDNDAYFSGPRLKLRGVKIVGRDNELIDEQRFSYLYEDAEMPNNPSCDLFGFYNGGDSDGLSDRTYSFECAQYYMLNRIEHVTGAYTRFAYQPNHTTDVTYWNEPVNVDIGIRIARIEVGDNSGILHTRAYEYTRSIPTIDFSKVNGSSYLASFGFATGFVNGYELTGLRSLSICSQSTLPGVSVEEAKLIHGQVVEKRYGHTQDTIRTVYEHQLPYRVYENTGDFVPYCSWERDADYPTDRFFSGAEYVVQGMGAGYSFLKKISIAFPGYFVNTDWMQGQLLKKQVYNWENGQYRLVEEVRNTYHHKNYRPVITGIYAKLLNTTVMISDNPSIAGGDQLADYYCFNTVKYTGRNVLATMSKTSYFDSGNVVERVEYTYPNVTDDEIAYGVVKSESWYVDDQLVRIKNYYYPFDYTDAVNEAQTERNQIQVPVKTELIKNGVPAASLESEHVFYGNTILLRSRFLKKNTEVVDRYDIYDYDRHRNPAYVGRNDESREIYIWGYNWSEPVAVIRNATYDELQRIDRDGMIDRIGACDKLTANSSEMAWLQSLRTLLPGAEVMLYTYEPLIGINTAVDASGRMTRYEYDGGNRLQAIRDENGNFLEVFKYHYKK